MVDSRFSLDSNNAVMGDSTFFPETSYGIVSCGVLEEVVSPHNPTTELLCPEAQSESRGLLCATTAEVRPAFSQSGNQSRNFCGYDGTTFDPRSDLWGVYRAHDGSNDSGVVISSISVLSTLATRRMTTGRILHTFVLPRSLPSRSGRAHCFLS